MWLDNGRKDGLLEKWYVVRKDNEARAQPGAEMRLGQKKDGKVGREGGKEGGGGGGGGGRAERRARKLEKPRALEMIERPRKLNSRIRSCRLGSSN